MIEIYSHSKYSHIILTLLIITVFAQEPSVATQNQNFIDPIVTNDANAIPAIKIPAQSQPSPTTTNNTQHSEEIHLNTSLHGV